MRRLCIVPFLVGAAGLVATAQAPPVPTAPLPLPFVATGYEPDWLLEITAERITLTLDEGATTLSTPTRAAEPVAGGRRYAGSADGRVLVIVVRDRACDDEATGAPFSHTVDVTLDEQSLKGCGGGVTPR